MLAGTPDTDQCIRYVSKHLTKSLDGGHANRILDALRYEPCSPTCPNWLRYGVQPKNAKPCMLPGRCRSKAHKPEHLGVHYAATTLLIKHGVDISVIQ